MSVPGQSLLANAKGRLLPFSVPFRFFLAAAVYLIIMWTAVMQNSHLLIGYRGGAGPVLAIIHLLTLGVLTMTVFGAALQLLSVATRRPLKSITACYLVSWLYIPGVAILTYGMSGLNTLSVVTGGCMVFTALLIFITLVLDNLYHAAGMGVITSYAWFAFLSLAAILVLGFSLLTNFFQGWLPDQSTYAKVHMVFAIFGFMGMLSAGFSHILIPMFALAQSSKTRIATYGFYLNAIALLILTVALLAKSNDILWLAIILGITGCSAYLITMLQVLRNRMRKRLGPSFTLIYAAWVALFLSFPVAVLLVFNQTTPAVYVTLLLIAWLLTLVLGILQRITPFLASMHIAKNRTGRSPLISDLTSDQALVICNYGQIIAGILLLTGLQLEQEILIRLGALAGILSAAALTFFLANIVHYIRLSIMPVAEGL